MDFETHRVGQHEVIQEAEDVFVYRFGPSAVTADELFELSQRERAIWTEKTIFSISIMHDSTTVSAGLVTRAGNMFRGSPARISAFVVRRHYMRSVLEFVLRTLRLLGAHFDSRFFEDEQAARAWIAERRENCGTSHE